MVSQRHRDVDVCRQLSCGSSFCCVLIIWPGGGMKISIRRRPRMEPWGTTSMLPVCSDVKLRADTKQFLFCKLPVHFWSVTGRQCVLIDCISASPLNELRSIKPLTTVSVCWCIWLPDGGASSVLASFKTVLLILLLKNAGFEKTCLGRFSFAVA